MKGGRNVGGVVVAVVPAVVETVAVAVAVVVPVVQYLALELTSLPEVLERRLAMLAKVRPKHW